VSDFLLNPQWLLVSPHKETLHLPCNQPFFPLQLFLQLQPLQLPSILPQNLLCVIYPLHNLCLFPLLFVRWIVQTFKLPFFFRVLGRVELSFCLAKLLFQRIELNCIGWSPLNLLRRYPIRVNCLWRVRLNIFSFNFLQLLDVVNIAGVPTLCLKSLFLHNFLAKAFSLPALHADRILLKAKLFGSPSKHRLIKLSLRSFLSKLMGLIDGHGLKVILLWLNWYSDGISNF